MKMRELRQSVHLLLRIHQVKSVQRLTLSLPPLHPALVHHKTTMSKVVSRDLSEASTWSVCDQILLTQERQFSVPHSYYQYCKFDESILKVVVCPLTKKPLRYDKENQELISDDIGVAYPIENGIPNLVPEDARLLKDTQSQNNSQQTMDKPTDFDKT